MIVKWYHYKPIKSIGFFKKLLIPVKYIKIIKSLLKYNKSLLMTFKYFYCLNFTQKKAHLIGLLIFKKTQQVFPILYSFAPSLLVYVVLNHLINVVIMCYGEIEYFSLLG